MEVTGNERRCKYLFPCVNLISWKILLQKSSRLKCSESVTFGYYLVVNISRSDQGMGILYMLHLDLDHEKVPSEDAHIGCS